MSGSTDGFRSEGHTKEQGDFKVDHAGIYGQLTEYVVRDPARSSSSTSASTAGSRRRCARPSRPA